MNKELILYKDLLSDIKNRIRKGQLKANLSANAEMLATYWDIGKIIHERQKEEGWGKGVIPRLALDLKNELAEVKGFSERNLKFMVQFYHEYQVINPIEKLTVSQLETDSILQLNITKSELEIGKLSVSKLETQSIMSPVVAKLEN